MKAVIVLTIMLYGCATPTTCPEADARVVQDTGGNLYIAFTIPEMKLWHDTIQSEARGECKRVKSG